MTGVYLQVSRIVVVRELMQERIREALYGDGLSCLGCGVVDDDGVPRRVCGVPVEAIGLSAHVTPLKGFPRSFRDNYLRGVNLIEFRQMVNKSLCRLPAFPCILVRFQDCLHILGAETLLVNTLYAVAPFVVGVCVLYSIPAPDYPLLFPLYVTVASRLGSLSQSVDVS